MVCVKWLLLSLALFPWTVAAEPGAAAWDDSHMRSNFARRFDDVPPRPAIRGSDRYHQVIEAPAETPRVGVAETTLKISPHEWAPGLGAGASAAGPLPPSSSGSGFTGAGNALATRSSALHTGSSSSSRSRR